MINLPQWVGGTDEEYETQHFGFGAQTLKIAVRQMIEQTICSGIKHMESHLHESLNLNETDKTTLTRSCTQLIKLYCERAAPSLQIIDEEIDRILNIPHNVLLPADEVQLEQLTDLEYNNLKDEVASLRKRIERASLMQALLTAEDEELSSVAPTCKVAKRDMDVLDLLVTNSKDGEVLKVHNETEFLCASAPFLSKSDTLDLFDPDNLEQ